MLYRKFNTLNRDVSALGLGTMRFPTVKDGDQTRVDEAKTVELIRNCIDHGINYIDTAWPYHNGESEEVVGKALRDGYREKVVLTTKLPCWLIESSADFDKYLDQQLEKLRTDHVDFYLLHALFTDRWEKMLSFDVFRWADRAVKDGRIGSLGFSFHDSPQLFTRIVDRYDWGMCQIQYNYLNENVQAGTRGLEYAASKGVPVVVMEPLLGGFLADPPGEIGKVIRESGKNPVDLALSWLFDRPEVSCVISGMSNLEQVEQNVSIAARAGVGNMSSDDMDIVKEVKKIYRSYHVIPCTKCDYCQPCPSGVRIPRIFEIYNESRIEGKHRSGQAMYNWHMKDSEKANNCTGCKACESHCPQKIGIADWMERIHEELAFKEK
ncbi:MAG: aldo/keto reductase [Chitinispirillaceae bacterium]